MAKDATGRPSEFTEEAFKAVCQELAEGKKSLRKICEADDKPAISTFLGWVHDRPELADHYARARDIQLAVWSEDCIEIADDDSRDFGYRALTNEEGQSAEVFINKDNIQRAKLRLDERHWQMSKMRPKKYGDFMRNEVTGKDGGPLEIALATRIQAARERAKRR